PATADFCVSEVAGTSPFRPSRAPDTLARVRSPFETSRPRPPPEATPRGRRAVSEGRPGWVFGVLIRLVLLGLLGCNAARSAAGDASDSPVRPSRPDAGLQVRGPGHDAGPTPRPPRTRSDAGRTSQEGAGGSASSPEAGPSAPGGGSQSGADAGTPP